VKEIKQGNLPYNPPVTLTVVVWLALDHWRAPGWLYGAAVVVMLILWVAAIYSIWAAERIDIIERVERLERLNR
jgi:hypothetical protein